MWFYLYYFSSVLSHKNHPKSSSLPPISIIIASRNEAENLKKLIPILLNQNYPQFEIIIVNDRSADNSSKVLLEFDDIRINEIVIKQVPEGRDAKKNAITIGIQHANFEHLVFTDADCRPASSNWLLEYGKIYSSSPETEVIIGYSPHYKSKGILGKFIEFETATTLLTYLGKAKKSKPYMAVGRNMSYTKTFFKQCDGFGSFINVTGGDDDIIINKYAIKEKTKVNTNPESAVYTFAKKDLRSYIKQKKRHLSVGKKYNLADKIFSASYWLSLIVQYAGLILIIWLPELLAFIISLYTFRLIIAMIVYYKAKRLLRLPLSTVMLSVLEILFIFYVVSLGTASLYSKKIKWN
ncbi:glycosyltransferase [Flammeovirgaceae bacterium KN852]|uniref:Glycosyltransferase n=2 Tax=Marinigracilibium pacificum TaxID=2729599 RepID=A0A848J3M1_9BACT|nr:glycosyltransferase [Marinigracilibium pacificum]